MTNLDLSKSYLIKAEKRLKILEVLLREDDYSDVIREAQEIVELSLKALLRFKGIDVPKIHEVSGLILKFKERLSPSLKKNLRRIVRISRYLRKERELSFYGDIDFIPTEMYSRLDAQKAILDSHFIVRVVKKEFSHKYK
ncbi:MAG: HEPN domain-containing protein [Candidatus Omnitrophica bacterium]|nr:HEPN domain-containing protein [Candidatus Omnitrophota bacterium]